VLQEYNVAGHLLLGLKSFTPAKKFLSVSAELNHNPSPVVFDSPKSVCCHHSSSYYILIGYIVTDDPMSMWLLEAAG